MHVRLAKLIEGPDTTDFVMRPESVLRRFSEKPEWGDTEAGHRRMMGDMELEIAVGKQKAATWSDDPLDGPMGR
ncbi:hypothetical protein [Octadecabacter sp. R77987]|uniref:hypothetical protein n=1 Tax=Octadecabacter sp. R77987 TaxID=3093874 RepID=UPI00366E1D7C